MCCCKYIQIYIFCFQNHGVWEMCCIDDGIRIRFHKMLHIPILRSYPYIHWFDLTQLTVSILISMICRHFKISYDPDFVEFISVDTSGCVSMWTSTIYVPLYIWYKEYNVIQLGSAVFNSCF